MIQAYRWKTPGSQALRRRYPYCIKATLFDRAAVRLDRTAGWDILRRDCLRLGLPLHSMELEFGPSQVEFVFRPAKAFDLRTT